MTEHKVLASEVKEGDLVALEGARKRVVEGNRRSDLNRSLREIRVRGLGTWHFKATETLTVWRDWGFPK